VRFFHRLSGRKSALLKRMSERDRGKELAYRPAENAAPSREILQESRKKIHKWTRNLCISFDDLCISLRKIGKSPVHLCIYLREICIFLEEIRKRTRDFLAFE